MKYIIAISSIVVLLLGVFFFQSISTLETVNEVTVVLDTAHPFQATVSFQLEEPQKVYIKYWQHEKKKEVAYSEISSEKLSHVMKLIALRSTTNYEFQLIGKSGNIERKSKIISFVTPKIFPPMSKLLWTQKGSKGFSGYILSQRSGFRSRSKENGSGFLFMTDSSGQCVWYNKVPGLPKISSWTSNNTVLVISGSPNHERSAGDHIYEYDIYGNEITNLDLSKLATPIEAHHDILYTPDGNLLTIAYDKKSFDLRSVGGRVAQELKADAIVRLSKNGEILWKWSVFDVLDPIKNPTYKYDSLGEWGHANTLLIDRDGHYLISFRDWNEIWKINSQNGSLIWKLGEQGDFKLPTDFGFSGQHSIHINHKGEYMMFDNGVKSKRSKVLAFTLDEQGKTVNVKLNIFLPQSLYTEKRGSASFIDENRILVCSAEVGTVAIVDIDGNILARAHTGLPDYYRATYIRSLY